MESILMPSLPGSKKPRLDWMRSPQDQKLQPSSCLEAVNGTKCLARKSEACVCATSDPAGIIHDRETT